MSSLRHLRHFRAQNTLIPNNLRLPPTIEIWDTASCCYHGPTYSPAWQWPLPHLKKLNIKSANGDIESWFRASLHGNCPSKLEYLSLHLDTEDMVPLFAMLHRSANLVANVKVVHMRAQGLADTHLEAFREHFAAVEALTLHSAQVTGVFLAGLITAPGSKLNNLKLMFCPKVSPDVVDWAKERNVTVEIRQSPEAGCRQIRGLD